MLYNTSEELLKFWSDSFFEKLMRILGRCVHGTLLLHNVSWQISRTFMAPNAGRDLDCGLAALGEKKKKTGTDDRLDYSNPGSRSFDPKN